MGLSRATHGRWKHAPSLHAPPPFSPSFRGNASSWPVTYVCEAPTGRPHAPGSPVLRTGLPPLMHRRRLPGHRRLRHLIAPWGLGLCALAAQASAHEGSPVRNTLVAARQFDDADAWPGVPQPTALEQQLFADAADGRFDHLGLAAAALVADGLTSPAELAATLQRIAAHCTEVRIQTCNLSDPVERGQLAFDYLHEHLLAGRYRADAHSLPDALADGDFNCVSSTVWWCVLAEAVGLDTWAVASPAHVAAQMQTAAGPRDCEPTSPAGFALPRGDELAARSGRRLNQPQLISLIYYNRALVAWNRGDFAAALTLNRHSLRLDPAHRAARDNLIATLNAWGLSCVQRGEFPRACRLIETAYQTNPHEQALAVNLGYACQQWAAHLSSRGAHSEALAVLARAIGHPATVDPRLRAALQHGAQRIWWQGW